MIGDYWDEQTVAKIVGLLYEYVDLFPHSFGEMKEEVVMTRSEMRKWSIYTCRNIRGAVCASLQRLEGQIT